MLERLEAADRAAELHPRLAVFDCHLEAPLGRADLLGGAIRADPRPGPGGAGRAVSGGRITGRAEGGRRAVEPTVVSRRVGSIVGDRAGDARRGGVDFVETPPGIRAATTSKSAPTPSSTWCAVPVSARRRHPHARPIRRRAASPHLLSPSRSRRPSATARVRRPRRPPAAAARTRRCRRWRAAPGRRAPPSRAAGRRSGVRPSSSTTMCGLDRSGADAAEPLRDRQRGDADLLAQQLPQPPSYPARLLDARGPHAGQQRADGIAQLAPRRSGSAAWSRLPSVSSPPCTRAAVLGAGVPQARPARGPWSATAAGRTPRCSRSRRAPAGRSARPGTPRRCRRPWPPRRRAPAVGA